MTMDGFLTLLALVAAVVAVIPSAMRRAVDLQFGVWQRLVVITGFVVVLFLEYYNTAKVILHLPSFGVATKYHLTPQNLAFGVVLLCGFYIVPVILWKRIPARRMEKLRRLIETLVESEEFGDAIEILSPHIAAIGNIYARRYEQQKARGRRMSMSPPRRI